MSTDTGDTNVETGGWESDADVMSTGTRSRDALLAEYNAWANGELSEISDEAMLAGSPKYQAVVRAILADNGGDEGAARRDLRAAYERYTRVIGL